MLLYKIWMCGPTQQQRNWLVYSKLRSYTGLYHLTHLIPYCHWLSQEEDNRLERGFTWSNFITLEDLDFADDVALLSSRHSDMQEKTERFSHFASQLGLQLNANKTEEMRFNVTSSNKLKVDGKEIKQVDKFIYLGSVVSIEDSTQKDTKNRLSKARTAFHKLRPIWKSNQNKNKAIQQQC